MKNVIEVSLLILITFILTSCNKILTSDSIQIRNDTAFAVGSDKPLTAKVIDYYDENNKKIKLEVNYKNGLKEGHYVDKYENGKVRSEANYQNGKKEGKGISYFKDGKIELEENYLDGKRSGTSVRYYGNGQKKEECKFSNGIYDGIYNSWYNNGQKELELLILNHTLRSNAKKWGIDGILKSNMNFDPVKLSSNSLLAKIEVYKAPQFAHPEEHETYDNRIHGAGLVPPTLMDVFIVDISIMANKFFEIRPEDNAHINEELFYKVIDKYYSSGWAALPGYRPWTHWNFIRQLTADERKKLAKESYVYFKEYGIRDPRMFLTDETIIENFRE